MINDKTICGHHWVTGYFVKHLPYTPAPLRTEEETERIKDDFKYYITQDGFSDWCLPRGIDFIEVEKESVGQFTGMLDKNKKEIYNGDIVRIYPEQTDCDNEKVIYEIFYEDSTCQYLCNPFIQGKEDKPLRGIEEFSIPLEEDINIEIIGNIIDNPELLKKI